MRCDPIEVDARPRRAGLACIGCGCTDDRACEGGCSWVQFDPPLCSACAAICGDIESMREDQHAAPAGGMFGVQRCPAALTPAPHALLWLDSTSGYCARCGEGFTS